MNSTPLVILVFVLSGCHDCGSQAVTGQREHPDVGDVAGSSPDVSPGDGSTDTNADLGHPDGSADTHGGVREEIKCTGTEEEELIAWFEENQRCTDRTDCIRAISWMPPPHHAWCSCETGIHKSADLDEYLELQIRFSTCTDYLIGCCGEDPKGPIECIAGYCY